MSTYRYGIDGERIEDVEPPLERVGPHRCTDGWLDDDEDGRARPCLECRPHLAGRTATAWRAPRLSDEEWNG